MIFSPRIGQQELANLSRRLAISLESGIEARRVFDREAHGRSSPGVRRQLNEISTAVARGSSIYDAIQATGNFFPPLFREMVQVGEQTGHADQVFLHLADHYENQVRLRRMFLSNITWPMVQLAAALSVVGLLIWVMGFLPPQPDPHHRGPPQPLDLLGFGLIGTEGLIRYVTILGIVAVVLVVLFQALRRGVFWVRPLQRLVLRTPVVGRALQTLSLARLAWSLELTYGSGMDLLKAIPLALRTMQNAYYSDHIDEITSVIRRGQEIHEALSVTGVFPADFLDAIEVGERSGRLPETMNTLSRQYQDQSQRALMALTTIAGFLVWALVATLIVFVIFRLFSFYIGQINEAGKM
ncbi:MAG TPA: type II secretion system F family protein [Pirellulales bacterium]|jgi:type IV pilus assembly protein PilC|nr:type II secretion system F family protein [Pirellulales bacterium]